MKTKPLLIALRPRNFIRWRDLPLFGPILDEFVQWMANAGYSLGTIGKYLQGFPAIVRWLRRRRITVLGQLTQQQLHLAHFYYCAKQQETSCVIGALESFLRESQLIPVGNSPQRSAVEAEVDRFASYLRESRGAAESTISGYSGKLRAFLQFLRFEDKADPLRRVGSRQIEAFLRKSARTNNRYSLKNIVGMLRAYFRESYARGKLLRPLHLEIDTPRIYAGERLPRALPWVQVQAFIQSVDRSGPVGRRDFTLLYLAAAYGLRSGELVHLTLGDIDWHSRSLRVMQTKTQQMLQLPLTDEAANVLIDYLRKTRPQSAHRQLFLHMRAPFIPLRPTAVNRVLERRLRCSGLKLTSLRNACAAPFFCYQAHAPRHRHQGHRRRVGASRH